MKNRIIMCDVAVDYGKYHDAYISKSKYKKLSKIRNYEPSGFAYVVESIKLLDKFCGNDLLS